MKPGINTWQRLPQFMRPDFKVSSHFEYLENRLCGLDVTLQPVRADLTVRPWTVTLPWGRSVSSETRWPSLCTVWPSHSNISSLSMAIFALGKNQKSQGVKPGLQGCWQTWVTQCLGGGEKKNPHESCRMGRRIDADWLSCLLGHCESDSHTVHKLSQRRLTADWLASWECYCSQMHSKVSSDWLPSYIKGTRPVLEIFKMAGYIPGQALYTSEVEVSVMPTNIPEITSYKHLVLFLSPNDICMRINGLL